MRSICLNSDLGQMAKKSKKVVNTNYSDTVAK